MPIQCDQCQKLKEKETDSVKWSDEPGMPDRIADILKRLEKTGYADDAFYYTCLVCGQEFKFITWNELFGDGWVEFSEIRKVNR